MIAAAYLALSGCETPPSGHVELSTLRPAAVSSPSTPAGRQLDAYMRAYNSGARPIVEKFTIVGFAPNAGVPPSGRAAQMVATRAFTGALAVRSVVENSPTSISAILQSEVTEEWFSLDLRVQRQSPSLIEEAKLDFAETPAGLPPGPPLRAGGLTSEARAFATRLAGEQMLPGMFFVTRRGATLIDLDTRPADNRGPMGVASVGKLFTIVAIAQLEQAGKLSLDDRVGTLLPDYPNADVAANVTIGHLLTHASGIPDYMEAADYQKWKAEFPGRRLPTIAAYLPFFANKPVEFRPGSQRAYSNSGYLVLGLIVERVTGLPFADYVAANVLLPAGVTSISRETIRPAGGELSTAGDLCSFGRALRTGKLLGSVQTQRVLSPVTLLGMANAYGVEVGTADGLLSFGHGGGAPGMSARLDVYPDAEFCVAVIATDEAAARRISEKMRRLIARTK